jgi:homocysteine S-methyltransferase
MSFLEALSDRVLVCDGAMGSVLYDRGVFVNQSFEALNVSRPELVVDVHRAYVEAGADVIETNTFGANRVKLAGFGLADQLAELNVAGARLARQAAGASGYVAGSIGPLGVRVGAGGSTTVGTAEAHFTEQAVALIEGGVDLLVLETFGEVGELEAAVRAVRRFSALPVVAQVAAGEDGRSLDGVTPEQFAGTLLAQGATLVGVNCGPGPAATLETVERMAAVTDAPLSAQPNAGGPKEVEGRRLMLSTPEFLASYARRFVGAGVGLVGGCCGTTPAHIARIKLAVAAQSAPRPVPVQPPAFQ